MRTRYYVSFNEGRRSYKRVQRLLDPIGCGEGLPGDPNDILAGCFSYTFDADDPRLEKLRALLKREGIEWSERKDHIYTDDELRSFPLIELYVEREPLPGTDNEIATYDLSKACLACGTGAIQTSPLRVPLSGLPKKGLVSAGFNGETLVAPRLMEALRDGKISGLELRQVVFYRNNEPLPWWQMIASFDMPKMSPLTRGIHTDEIDHPTNDGFVIRALPPCPQCRRDGRYHSGDEPNEIVYSRADIDPVNVPDVARTWESFGVSGIDKERPQLSRFGDHRLLVKPKVFDIFRRLKVKRVCFVPVHFVD